MKRVRWLLLCIGLLLVVAGFWRWKNTDLCNPKIVDNKIDVLGPGCAVRVSIGPDGQMTIVKP